MINKACVVIAAFLLFTPAFVGAEDAPPAGEASADGTSADAPVADAPSAAETQSAPEPVSTTPPVDGAPADVLIEDGNVTVDFKDADIQNVLRILSYKSGVNIVAGKDVTGSVTIRLVNVPWEKALDVVLKTYGYAYDRTDNIIRVTTLENLKTEELSTEVFTLNYSSAADVEGTLKDVLSERGRIRSDSRSNTLIVTDMPTTLQRVQRVIERLDRSTPQVVIQAKVIETALGKEDNLGIKWNTTVKVSGSSRPTTLPFPAARRTALHTYFPDGRGTTSVTSAATSSTTSTSTILDFPSRVNQPSFPVADKAEFKFGTLDFSEFQAILKVLNERENTKILSEPHVTTLNNQEAKILVGEIIAIPTFERNLTTGRMEITGYKDRDLGIRLSVIPQINDANEIVVDIHPEITSLLGYDDLTNDIKAPRFTTREAKTQVRIANGQTIAIGGLIRENIVDNVTKVPVLGDIPILSNFFSFTNKRVTKTDLLFFMTVHIVSEKNLPAGHPEGKTVAF